jgi:hypothetical protein
LMGFVALVSKSAARREKEELIETVRELDP